MIEHYEPLCAVGSHILAYLRDNDEIQLQRKIGSDGTIWIRLVSINPDGNMEELLKTDLSDAPIYVDTDLEASDGSQ